MIAHLRRLAVASMTWTTGQQVHADGGTFGGVRSTAAVDTSYAQDLDQSLKGRQIVTARSRLHHATVDHRGATFHVIIGRRHRVSTASGFRTDLVVGARELQCMPHAPILPNDQETDHAISQANHKKIESMGSSTSTRTCRPAGTRTCR